MDASTYAEQSAYTAPAVRKTQFEVDMLSAVLDTTLFFVKFLPVKVQLCIT